ncbi:MAG: LytTR family DNA-binding domain-containing protein [Bacteroidia bacterium]|nr:LytTR family DNA-binding domain-containing protein [Bacteroidia bacterium]
MNYSCLIVDDERPALKLLTAYISKLPHLKLVASCENALEATAALGKEQVDLLFLDIQMPELTGLEMLKLLRIKPKVILTTAYREFAVEGFSLDATDYLVKPFSFERFLQAVNKATNQIQLEKTKAAPPQSDSKEEVTQDHFFVRSNHKMEKVDFAEIRYLESMREYVAIYTTKRKFVVHQTMNQMEKELPSTNFMRVHRSFMINLDKIESVMGNMILIGDQKIGIGASYKKRFFDQLRLL